MNPEMFLDNLLGPTMQAGVATEHLSLRDFFAALALAGLAARAPIDVVSDSQIAYAYADAMLKAREQ